MSEPLHPGQSSSVQTPPFSFGGKPLSSQGPETVLNPERRGQGAGVPALPPSSAVWRRLFPPEVGGEGEAAPAVAGVQLGQFEVQERIGAGGMGAVFRAVDQRLKRVVALKVLSPAHSRDPNAVQRFLNEARAAAQLDDDHIARVYCEGEDHGLQYIAFEYIQGTNVRDLIAQQGRLPVADAVNFSLQIAAALKHTSAAGVIHRDIKPSNIIITPNGRAKLVDLGLARKETADSQGDLTLAGTTLGTFDYISPEQAKDPRNVDVRSDIYSLGCTLYHMLTGEPPYSEGTVLQKLLNHQGKDPPDPAEKNRRVPRELSAVVKKMMASDPRKRYPTAEALIRDLLLVAYRLGLRGVHPDSVVWTSVTPSRERAWERHVGWVSTVATLLIIVLLLEWLPANKLWPPRFGSSAPSPPALDKGAPPVAPVMPHTPSDQAGVPADDAAQAIAAARTDSPAMPARPSADGSAPVPPAESDPDGIGPPPPLFDGQIPSVVAPSGTSSTAPGGVAVVGAGSTGASTGAVLPATGSAGSVVVAPKPPPAGAASAAEPATAPPVADPQLPAISIQGEPGSAYPSLWAACEAADHGDIIVLRYNGRRGTRPERPLRIAKKQITIRADEGFRPVVEFAAPDGADFGETRMVTLVDGALSLHNVDLQMNVRDDVSTDLWAVFSLQGAEQLSLQGATVTVKNPAGRAAAVIEAVTGPEQSLARMDMMKNGQPATEQRFAAKLGKSIVRGDCDLLVSRQSLPGLLDIDQSLVALDGLMGNGSLLAALSRSDSLPKPAELELRLGHVTCLLSGRLIRLDGEPGRNPLPVNVASARNNIIAARNPQAGPVLISTSGDRGVMELRQLVRWNGEKNFYDGFRTFWQMQTVDGSADARTFDFDRWVDYWSAAGEVDPHASAVQWLKNWRERPLVQISARDAVLVDDPLDNPAVRGGSDGTPAGADVSALPLAPPVEP